jgi:hypothetical protein
MIRTVVLSELARRLVPDELWELAAPLIPQFTPRAQGGGTASLDDRLVFTAGDQGHRHHSPVAIHATHVETGNVPSGNCIRVESQHATACQQPRA